MCDNFDFHVRAFGQRGNLDSGPRRKISAEVFRINFVHRSEVRQARWMLDVSCWTFFSYSHSMVPGGFDVMSRTQRLMPFTSFTMRLLMRARRS